MNQPQTLQRCAFWLEERTADWQSLLSGRPVRHSRKDVVLYHQGMPIQELLVMLQGRVRLVTYSQDGHERHVMVIGPGGLLGDAGMADPGTHLTSAVVSADAVLCAVPLQEAMASMQAHAGLMRQVLAFSDRRFQTMLQHHELLCAGSALKRVGLALLGLIQVYGSPHSLGTRISMRFTQSEMASICSISRMSVSTVFSMLAERRLLLRDGPFIVLPDIDDLERIALSGVNTQTSASPRRPLM